MDFLSVMFLFRLSVIIFTDMWLCLFVARVFFPLKSTLLFVLQADQLIELLSTKEETS